MFEYQNYNSRNDGEKLFWLIFHPENFRDITKSTFICKHKSDQKWGNKHVDKYIYTTPLTKIQKSNRILGFSSSILLVVLLATLDPFPALPVTVFVVLYLRVINTVGVTPASLSAGILSHDSPSNRCLTSDARLGEQSLILFELPVPLVLANTRLCSCQISAIPTFVTFISNFLDCK